MARTKQTASKKRAISEQKRNTRQKRAGLSGMRVGKVERRVRSLVKLKIKGGLTTGIAYVLEEVTADLLSRALQYTRKEKRCILKAIDIARGLSEEGCLLAALAGCSKVGGISV